MSDQFRQLLRNPGEHELFSAVQKEVIAGKAKIANLCGGLREPTVQPGLGAELVFEPTGREFFELAKSFTLDVPCGSNCIEGEALWLVS